MRIFGLLFCFFWSVLSVAQINQNFDVGSFLPVGWSEYHSGTDALKDTNERAYSPTKSALFDDEFGTDTSWMVLAQITNLAANSELTFWQNQNYGTYYTYHGVWVSTTSGNPTSGSFIELDSLGAGTEDTWEQKTIDLSTYTGQDIYLAFVYIGDFADEWYLDDIEVSVAGQTSCSPPTNITASNITSNSIKLSWTPVGGELSWVIEYGLAGFTYGTGTTINASSPQITVPNLLENTYYDYYVRAKCPSNITSNASSVGTEKTLCSQSNNVISIPYSEGFESVVTPTLPCGWTQVDINGDQVKWVTSGNLPNNGANSALITYTDYDSVKHDDWLFSPSFMVLDTSLEYKVGFSYTSKSSGTFPEKMEFYSAKNIDGTGLQELFFWDTAILTNNVYHDTNFVFKFTDTGNHYFGFHAFSDGDQWDIMIDDFYLELNNASDIYENTIENNIKVYPNPTKSQVNIASLNNIEELYLYNSTGKLIKTYLVNNATFRFSLEGLNKGLYLIKIKTKKGVVNKRIIKG